MASSPGKFDLLLASASDVQRAVDDGIITYEEYATQSLEQIAKHNHNGLCLNAVISTVDRDTVLSKARAADELRKSQPLPNPLFGIIAIVKDVYNSPSLNLGTTCGSYALKNAVAKEDAYVLNILQKLGVIIVGKANLSEWGGLKGNIAGWSPVGGQTQTPYVAGGVQPNATFLGHSTPAGSSAGSAAGVAAGFATISLGTESDGSLVGPATRGALYALKGTLGSINTAGSQPVSPAYDCIGGMAKTPADLVYLTAALQETNYQVEDASKAAHNLRIGFVDPDLWQPADFVVEPNEDFRKQTYAAMDDAASRLRDAGVHVERDVRLISYPETTTEGGGDIDDLMNHDIPDSLERYFASFETIDVRSLQDLVDFNRDHPELELPEDHNDQDALVDALQSNMTRSEYESAISTTRKRTQNAIMDTLKKHDIVAILGPADARIPSVAAQAGYPVGTVPLGLADFNGRAFGMNVVAPSNHEQQILSIMTVWDAVVGQRKAPPLVANWNGSEGKSRI